MSSPLDAWENFYIIIGSSAGAPRPPLKRCKRYSAARVEANPFLLQDSSLPAVGPVGCADATLRIYDPLPRNRTAGWQCVKRVTHETRLSRQAGKTCDLPVSRYASAGNLRNNRVDSLM
jgi:hypothetical protein